MPGSVYAVGSGMTDVRRPATLVAGRRRPRLRPLCGSPAIKI
jgi:hypothetical protein